VDPAINLAAVMCRGLHAECSQVMHSDCRLWRSISKKHFCPGRMAPSEWTHFCRVHARLYSRQRHPSSWLMHARCQYHTSRCILPPDCCFAGLSCSVGFQTLIRHSGIVANCDYMSEWVIWAHACIRISMHCDTVKISPCIHSTWSFTSGDRRWEIMTLPGRENARNIGKSELYQKLRMKK
jgi:hypothetical protein